MHDECARRTPAVCAAMTLWAALALGWACRSGPAGPGETDEPDQSVLCDSDGSVGTAYGAGVNCRTVQVDGYQRDYLVYLPPAYEFTAEAPTPVVLMFHGGGGTGERFLKISRWREKADEVGFIAVFPTGLEYFILDKNRIATRWNEFNLPAEVDLTRRPAGYPEEAPWPADDIAFIHAVLDDLEAVAHADPAALYASGFSNGATFTSRLAVEATGRIAAFAWVGGGFCHSVTADWTSAAPRPALMVLGTHDEKLLGKVAASGGPALDAFPLDADSLLEVEPLADCLAWQVDAYDLAWDKRTVTELSDVTEISWSTSQSEPWGNTFRFAMLAGLEHKYPNGDNNPLGWVAVNQFWTFFQGNRLVEGDM